MPAIAGAAAPSVSGTLVRTDEAAAFDAKYAYAQVHIKPITDPERNAICTAISSGSAPNWTKSLVNVLINKKSVLSSSVVLTQVPEYEGVVGSKQASSITLDFLKLNRSGGFGNSCTQSLGLFETQKFFATGWIPLTQQPTEGAVVLNVTWNTVLTQTDDAAARIKGLWQGLGTLVGLSGPVSVISNALFPNNTDSYSIKSQVATELRKAGFPVGDPENEADTWKQSAELVIWGPASRKPNSIRLALGGIGGSGEPSPGGTLDLLEFRTSFKTSRILTDAQIADLAKSGTDYESESVRYLPVLHEKIPISSVVTDGRSLKEISESLANLADQKTPALFDAACPAARADLTQKQFARGDITLALYAAAVQNIEERELRKVQCLFDAEHSGQTRSDLKVHFSRSPGGRISLTDAQRDRIKLVFETGLSKPSEKARAKLVDLLGNAVRMGGTTGVLARDFGEAFKAQELVETKNSLHVRSSVVSSDGLVSAIPTMFSQCSGVLAANSEGVSSVFPSQSGLDEPEDSAVFVIGTAGKNWFLAIAGITANDDKLTPIKIDGLWIGDRAEKQDQAFIETIAAIQGKCGLKEAKDFLDTLPQTIPVTPPAITANF